MAPSPTSPSRWLGRQLVPPPTPRPKKTHDQVSFQGTTIEYHIRRSPRRKKTIEFSLTPDGLLVSAPARASYAQIRSIVLSRAPKLIKLLAESPNEGQPLAFVTGDSMPYLGRSIPLVIEPADVAKPIVELNAETFRVSVPPTIDYSNRRETLHKAFEAWYRARAQDHIPPLVDDWWSRMGLRKKYRVIVRTQRSQWGSCAPDGALRFSWRNMMLPPDVIEYVVVHELAHLKVMGHSPKFWDVVTRALPDAKQRRKLLREHGSVLPL